MSTRSIIVVTGRSRYRSEFETIRLYKHSDGYPTGNLPIILKSIQKSKEIEEDNNTGFKQSSGLKITADSFAGLVVGEAVTMYGMGARIEKRYFEELNPDHLGGQCDLEWIYIVNTEKRTVEIYGGGFTGKAPQFALKKGMVDPVIYAKRYRDESFALKITQEMVKAIEAEGYSVNKALGSKKPTRKSKKAA